MDAPLNAAEAAGQLDDVWHDLWKAREAAAKHANVHAKAETLYRTCKSRALISGLDGRNQAERDAQAHEWPLTDQHRVEATQVAEAAGLDGWTPETIGDLRWLRDRAGGLAESWSAKAYDQRARISAWQTVASMAKAEAEMAPPERMGA